MSNNCKIVMYHYVRPIKNSKYPKIKGLELDAFQRQISYFKKNFYILSATEFIDILVNNQEIKKNSILLTFDDGLKDHFSYTYPILKKNKINGLFFISSFPILEKKILDVHKIHFILEKNKDHKEIHNELIQQINENKQEYNLLSVEEYESKLSKPNRFDSGETIFIKRLLQRDLPLKLRESIVELLFEKYVTPDLNSFRNNLYLSEDEINEMVEGSMYFGSHGHSHEWYTELSNEQLKKELKISYNFTSKINISEKRIIFCYPFGNYNDSVIKEVKQAQYVAGLTTDVGDAKIDNNNLFKIKRYDTNDFPQ